MKRKKRLSYRELLEDPLWKAKRAKIVKRAQNRCQICASQKQPLHVHHSYYANGKKPWQYPDGSLICICENCHAGIHALKEFKAAGKNLRDRWKHEEPPPYNPPPGEERGPLLDSATAKERFLSIFAELNRVAD